MAETITAIIVGVLLGIGMVLLYIAYRIKMVTNALDDYIEEALNQVKDSFITIKIEKDNSTYYCYKIEDHQFVCQGNTVDEIKDAFKLKYPDKVAIVSKETDEAIVAEFKKALSKDV